MYILLQSTLLVLKIWCVVETSQAYNLSTIAKFMLCKPVTLLLIHPYNAASISDYTFLYNLDKWE